ncbi:MAG: hypothetical protein RQ741_09525 [Wenzhouxiangellaceae bacterium]|nr:hypothetical protein [Wenzhouxiangellaceae bacterium]
MAIADAAALELPADNDHAYQYDVAARVARIKTAATDRLAKRRLAYTDLQQLTRFDKNSKEHVNV